jgi:hypothetical protein
MTTKTQNKLPLLGQATLIVALLFAARASAMTKAFEVNVRVRFVELQPTSSRPKKFDWHPNSLKSQPLPATLTDKELHAVLKALDQHDGADLLSDNQITTLSGRDVQLQPARNGAPINPNLGIVVKVSSDGLTVVQRPSALQTAFSTSQALPQPRSRVVQALMNLNDGQTLVLCGLSPNLLIFVTPTVIGPSGNPIHFRNYYDTPPLN